MPNEPHPFNPPRGERLTDAKAQQEHTQRITELMQFDTFGQHYEAEGLRVLAEHGIDGVPVNPFRAMAEGKAYPTPTDAPIEAKDAAQVVIVARQLHALLTGSKDAAASFRAMRHGFILGQAAERARLRPYEENVLRDATQRAGRIETEKMKAEITKAARKAVRKKLQPLVDEAYRNDPRCTSHRQLCIAVANGTYQPAPKDEKGRRYSARRIRDNTESPYKK